MRNENMREKQNPLISAEEEEEKKKTRFKTI